MSRLQQAENLEINRSPVLLVLGSLHNVSVMCYKHVMVREIGYRVASAVALPCTSGQRTGASRCADVRAAEKAPVVCVSAFATMF